MACVSCLSIIFDKFLFKILIDNGTKLVAATIPKSQFVTLLLIVAIIFIIGKIFRTRC